MIEVLKHHPRADEKIGVGVRGIRVQREAQWGTMQFAVIRTDGSDTDFSFKKCLYPVSKLQVFKKPAATLSPTASSSFDTRSSHKHSMPWRSSSSIRKRLDVNAIEITGLADGEMRKGFADAMLAER